MAFRFSVNFQTSLIYTAHNSCFPVEFLNMQNYNRSGVVFIRIIKITIQIWNKCEFSEDSMKQTGMMGQCRSWDMFHIDILYHFF